jgi:transposase-like protein
VRHPGKGNEQGKELQVAKKRVGRYPKEFRRVAVERLKKCDNIVALSRELGVHRRLLYKWWNQLDRAEIPEESPPRPRSESYMSMRASFPKRQAINPGQQELWNNLNHCACSLLTA